MKARPTPSGSTPSGSNILIAALLVAGLTACGPSPDSEETKAELPPLPTLAPGPIEAWPDYRGPLHNGDAGSPGLPVSWSETENVRWKTPIHDVGFSTPVVLDGKIWLTTATEDGKALYALAVDFESGQILHDVKVFDIESPQEKHELNSYATPSPVVEPGRVYVHFGAHGTAALDTQSGEVLWTRTDIECNHRVGPASSPVLFEDLLILQMDGLDLQFLIALDTSTGETVWRSDRPTDFGDIPDDEWKKSYSTPLLLPGTEGPVLVNVAAAGVFGHDARSGEELWRYRYQGFSTTPRPISDGPHIVFSSGHGVTSLIGFARGGRGDVTAQAHRWIDGANVPKISSPVLVDGLLYLVTDGGIASCRRAIDGTMLWRLRVGAPVGASPIHADGHVYFFDRKGRALILKAGEGQPEEVGRPQLDEGMEASPVVYGSSLILRTLGHLYRVEKSAESAETAAGP